MGSRTALVVPAAVPRASVIRVPVTPEVPTEAIPVQPRPVPTASVLAVELAAADAETTRRLRAELDALWARLTA
jgi:hypothetical protein